MLYVFVVILFVGLMFMVYVVFVEMVLFLGVLLLCVVDMIGNGMLQVIGKIDVVIVCFVLDLMFVVFGCWIFFDLWLFELCGMFCVGCYDLGCVFVLMLLVVVLVGFGVLEGSWFGCFSQCNVLLLLYVCYVLCCYFYQDDDVFVLLLFGGLFSDGCVDMFVEQICGLLFDLNEMNNWLLVVLLCKVNVIEFVFDFVVCFGVLVWCDFE